MDPGWQSHRLKLLACGLLGACDGEEGGEREGARGGYHPDGQFESIYGHFKQALVSLGDVVEAGQLIGLADNTGNSSGAHLHLTLKKRGDGSPWLAKSDIVNPTCYLPDIFPGNGWRVDVGGNLRTGPADTFPVIRFIAAGPTVRATARFGHAWWGVA